MSKNDIFSGSYTLNFTLINLNCMKDASNRIKENIMAEIEIGFSNTFCASKTHILWEKNF